MPPSLRKACHACVKAKRKCVPQLPSCPRCAQKQIPCGYDLEPVSQGETLSTCQQDPGGSETGHANDAADFKIVYHSVSSAREASIVAIADGHGPASPNTRPRMIGTPGLTAYVINFFAEVVQDGSSGRGTPFVHVHILNTQFAMDESSTRVDSFRRLIEIHDFTIRTLTMLLSRSASRSDTGLDNLVSETFSKVHALWSSPPQHFDHSFNPWEAWLTAESIRRSMFAAAIVKGLLSLVRNGYVTYEPFFESIPFDPRAGLWEAQNQEEWEAALEPHGGDHVKLKSYHEFITDTGSRLNQNEDGSFQRLLFLCYHCDAGIQYLRELDRLDH